MITLCFRLLIGYDVWKYRSDAKLSRTEIGLRHAKILQKPLTTRLANLQQTNDEVCWGFAHQIRRIESCKRLTTIAVSAQCKVLSAPSYANDIFTPKKRGGKLLGFCFCLPFPEHQDEH
jgi:hypothetical protein